MTFLEVRVIKIVITLECIRTGCYIASSHSYPHFQLTKPSRRIISSLGRKRKVLKNSFNGRILIFTDLVCLSSRPNKQHPSLGSDNNHIQSSSTMSPPVTISHADLFHFWHTNIRGSVNNFDDGVCLIIGDLNLIGLDTSQRAELKDNLRGASKNLERLWNKCSRSKKSIMGSSWFKDSSSIELLSRQDSQNLGGRPKKSYIECGPQSRSFKSKTATSSANEFEILHRAADILKSHGHNQVAKLVSIALNQISRPEIAKDILQSSVISPQKAVAVILDSNLSTNSYIRLNRVLNKNKIKVLPSYPIVKSAQYQSIPESTVKFNFARCNMQPLLNMTSLRLIQTINDLDSSNNLQLTLISKWGLDGSGGHQLYRQKFGNCLGADSHILSTQLVPIRLHLNDAERTIIWQNPSPNSNRLCRPIALEFIKDTSHVTNQSIARVNNQISNLSPSIIGSLTVHHKLFFTMLDGKTFNQMTGTSGKMCPICKVHGDRLNSVDPSLVDCDLYKHGLCTLHGLLRGLDFFLSIAYGTQDPKGRKQKIQDDFKEQLNLLIDIPLPGGGTSNTGNTARKFFREFAISSQITGIPEFLIERYHTIITALATTQLLDPIELRQYTTETANHLRSIYPSKNLTPTVHKILYHSADIVAYFNQYNIPIGLLSEEALESRNKDIRNNRYKFSRKTGRVQTLIDMFNRLMYSTDPLFDSFRVSSKVKVKSYSPAVSALFLNRPEFVFNLDHVA